MYRLAPVVEARCVHIDWFQPQVSTALMLKAVANTMIIKIKELGVGASAGQAAAFIPARLGQPDLPTQLISPHLQSARALPQ